MWEAQYWCPDGPSGTPQPRHPMLRDTARASKHHGPPASVTTLSRLLGAAWGCHTGSAGTAFPSPSSAPSARPGSALGTLISSQTHLCSFLRSSSGELFPHLLLRPLHLPFSLSPTQLLVWLSPPPSSRCASARKPSWPCPPPRLG